MGIEISNAAIPTCENSEVSPEPFLRWAGGKRQLLPVLHAATPRDFLEGRGRYFEPFLGGGAFMFSLWQFEDLRTRRGRWIVAGDVNPELINLYEVLQRDPFTMIRYLSRIARRTDERSYYAIRDQRPRGQVQRAARTVFLNRLCFNGLYRVNSHGGFNVPYGQLKNPTVCDVTLLESCSRWLSRAKLRLGRFQLTLADVRRGDFVYLDPPYIPLSKTAAFTAYAKSGFGLKDQEELADEIRRLDRIGARVMLSNSDSRDSRRIFADLNLHAVRAGRSISASAQSRKSVTELIACNYPMSDFADSACFRELAVA
jgi:DNA adenine methylase